MEQDWKKLFEEECTQIENTEICPHCQKKALKRILEYDYFFVCTNCGARYEFDGKYQNELDYYLASKQ